MNDERLARLYNAVTGEERICFYSIFDRNIAHITIYNVTPFTWYSIFLREVYEELQKELPSIKKKVIAKAIRELKEEYSLDEMLKFNMEYYRLQLFDNPALKCFSIDRRLKNSFKNYVKEAFKQNRVKWHWWNNLEWGL